MSKHKPTSLQDILKRRQQDAFVGRGKEQTFFHRNLRYALEDERRRFSVSVSGQGGVGKAWLLRADPRFQALISEAASTDEREAKL